jgi:hypothetical protein
MTFDCILSRKDNPDKFLFTTITECVDRDDCLNHLAETLPDFQLEQIRLSATNG